jgi:chromosome partitioning protein
VSLVEPEEALRAPAGGRRARIIAVANQKGGVGKTTTAVDLATAFVGEGRRVLVVDLDPQTNATTGLGVSERNTLTSYQLLLGEAEFEAAVVASAVLGLDVLPASSDLAAAEIELRSSGCSVR